MSEKTTKQKSKEDRFDLSTRKSRLAAKIIKWFKKNRKENLSFGEILDKYCKHGMGRATVCVLLKQLTNNEINVKETALYEAWQASRAQEGCRFVFHSKWPGNPYHGNRGQTRTPIKKPTVELSLKKHPVHLSCLECGAIYKKRLNITVAPDYFVGLKTIQCKECNEYGTSVAKFNLNKKTVFKGMIDNHEEFVQLEDGKLITKGG